MCTTHGAGTHSIEGKKWYENAEHIAQDVWGCSAFMLSKWDSYCRVHLGSPSQNFFRAPPARSAGKPMEHSYRYRLRFGTRSGCQNFRASFHQASNQKSTGFGLKNFFRAPPARSAGKPMEHSYRCRLRFWGADLAAKTSEHLSEGFQKLPGVFPSVFCTMTYTFLGSQIPHLSKETHKKTSMTVHLRLKCECSVACLFISA